VDLLFVQKYIRFIDKRVSCAGIGSNNVPAGTNPTWEHSNRDNT
jgi:hypothetical protein